MKFLGLLFVAVILLVSGAWAAEWKSLDGTEPETTPSPRSSSNPASAGIESTTAPQRPADGNATDPDTALAMMAKKYKHAVAAVVVITNKGPMPFGTAWAVSQSLFATNSHITNPVNEFLNNGLDVFVALNEKPDRRFRVVKAISHPRYRETKRNFDGKKSFTTSFDVGLLKIEGVAPVVFPLADKSELKKLAPGYRVAYLGFPTEDLIGGNYDVRRPLATMKSGIITTVSDYWLGDGGIGKNFLLRHNMGSAGGASGSPLFNTSGEVVGIHNAGNYEGVFVRDEKGNLRLDKEGSPIFDRAPNAAMINFAQRVDLLNDILP